MEKYPLLREINSPGKLRRLGECELSALAEEIRSFLIEKTKISGGHLASNLGVVELTMALHRVFSAPRDRVIFDVGHQAYVHKLLTGRMAGFDCFRTPGGMSGFTKRKESEYDPFGAGHSSTSLSAALGFAEADLLAGRDNYTVAVIGDGAYTGGMVHEALNNIRRDLRLIVILNENEMSISPNCGGFARYMAKVRNSRSYRNAKDATSRVISSIPLVGKPLHHALRGLKQSVKDHLYSSNYFEEMGLYYLGPADGHDLATVEYLMREAKAAKGPVLLHVKTLKGKGYPPAERYPEKYHSLPHKKGETFPLHMGKTLTSLAEEDPSVVAVTAAMKEGTGLSPFFRAHPRRAYDVGIAEEHALTFAAGMAAAGMKPYLALYSTFMQRGYDNILHDIALQNLPVRILVDRAALSPGDGATHHGIFDVAFLSHIPSLSLFAPATYGSLDAMLRDSLNAASPLAIRYGNLSQSEEVDRVFYPEKDYENYGVRADFSSPDGLTAVICAYGRMAGEALKAKALLQKKGVGVGVVLLETLKPYDKTAEHLLSLLRRDQTIVFMEEGVGDGGAGMILHDRLQKSGYCGTFKHLAIFDSFAEPPAPQDLFSYCKISAQDAVNAVLE